MTYTEALKQIKLGNCVTRDKYKNDELYITLIEEGPDVLPWIALCGLTDRCITWNPCIEDLNAKDWKIIKNEKNNINFSTALEYLKNGVNVSRREWNNIFIYLELIKENEYIIPGDESSTRYQKCLSPWIGIRTADGKFTPWTASHADLLADDWFV